MRGGVAAPAQQLRHGAGDAAGDAGARVHAAEPRHLVSRHALPPAPAPAPARHLALLRVRVLAVLRLPAAAHHLALQLGLQQRCQGQGNFAEHKAPTSALPSLYLQRVEELVGGGAGAGDLDGVVAAQGLDDGEQVVEALPGPDGAGVHAALEAQPHHVQVELARLPRQPRLAGLHQPEVGPAESDRQRELDHGGGEAAELRHHRVGRRQGVLGVARGGHLQ